MKFLSRARAGVVEDSSPPEQSFVSPPLLLLLQSWTRLILDEPTFNYPDFEIVPREINLNR